MVLGLLWCNTGFAECIKGDCNNGYGTYTYANGSKYVGEWKDGKENGQGAYTFANGTVDKGIWKKEHYTDEESVWLKGNPIKTS